MIEENGEFKQVFVNEQKLPATITNYSMHLGEKLGLIKSSNITDLADLDAVFRSALDPEANREEALKGVDTTSLLVPNKRMTERGRSTILRCLA